MLDGIKVFLSGALTEIACRLLYIKPYINSVIKVTFSANENH